MLFIGIVVTGRNSKKRNLSKIVIILSKIDWKMSIYSQRRSLLVIKSKKISLSMRKLIPWLRSQMLRHRRHLKRRKRRRGRTLLNPEVKNLLKKIKRQRFHRRKARLHLSSLRRNRRHLWRLNRIWHLR